MNARVEPAHDDLLKNSKKARREAGLWHDPLNAPAQYLATTGPLNL
jgi:hypothetical protein